MDEVFTIFSIRENIPRLSLHFYHIHKSISELGLQDMNDMTQPCTYLVGLVLRSIQNQSLRKVFPFNVSMYMIICKLLLASYVDISLYV